MATCVYPECNIKRSSGGYCQGHVKQLKAGQQLMPLGYYKTHRESKQAPTCSFIGCDRKTYAKHLCRPHREQLRRGERLAPIDDRARRAAKATKYTGCAFPECPRPHFSRALCVPHYAQWREGKPMHPIGDGPTRRQPDSWWWAKTPAERRQLTQHLGNVIPVLDDDERGVRSERAKRRWAEGKAAPKDVRVCRGCGVEFQPASGPQIFCSKPCWSTSRRFIQHGMTLEQFSAWGDRCAICGELGSHIDHDHATGHVRGFLCNRCNTALGKFRDSPVLLRNAAAYIESGGAVPSP
jgi:hypothetical protein